jgi:hypothetical protein
MIVKEHENVTEVSQGIFVVSNLIQTEDIQTIIKFIDDFQHLAVVGKKGKKSWIPVGVVPLSTLSGIDNLDKIKFKDFPEDLQNTFNKTLKTILTYIEKLFNDQSEIHCSNASFSRQSSGAKVPRHMDSTPENDGHIYYSSVLYLNTIADGDIKFPDLGVSYRPKAGDFIMYRSRDNNNEHEVDLISETRYSVPIFLSKDKNFYIE